jgi:hypothetical protein
MATFIVSIFVAIIVGATSAFAYVYFLPTPAELAAVGFRKIPQVRAKHERYCGYHRCDFANFYRRSFCSFAYLSHGSIVGTKRVRNASLSTVPKRTHA